MEALKQHMVEVNGTKPAVADLILQKLGRHADILAELKACVAVGEFPAANAVAVEGYTAKDIAALAPHLNDVGVYAFLVTLRENPQKAKDIIARGFPRK